jgi:NADH:ubiquinone oxidoreductase subunit K
MNVGSAEEIVLGFALIVLLQREHSRSAIEELADVD